MIFQLFRKFLVGKLLCKVCNVARPNRAVRRAKRPFVPADIPLDPGFALTSKWGGALRQAKPQWTQELQAPQALRDHSIVEPSLLPALRRPGHGVEQNQSIDYYLRNYRNAGYGGKQDERQRGKKAATIVSRNSLAVLER